MHSTSALTMLYSISGWIFVSIFYCLLSICSSDVGKVSLVQGLASLCSMSTVSTAG